VLVLSSLSPSAIAAPHRVKDLNTGPAVEDFPAGSIGISTSAGVTAAQDGLLYFRSVDPAHGSELWRTDGTEAGTVRLTDVCPGRCNSFVNSIQFFQDRVYFAADDGVSGNELWVSDGTPGSERRVRDVCPGPCHGVLSNFEPLDDALYFLATRGQELQLWKSDGSRSGTSEVAAVCPSTDACTSYFVQRLGDLILFTVSDATGNRIWSSDGTPEGTGPIDLPQGAGDFILNGEHVFERLLEAFGPELKARRRVTQLRDDAKPSLGRPHAAFENGFDVQHVADPPDVLRSATKLERRRPCRNAESGDARQRVGDFFGDTFGKVIEILVTTQVHERQYGNRRDASEPCAG